MSKVTGLRPDKNKRRIIVSLDSSLSFAVDMEVVVAAGLHIGQDLSADRIEELKEANLSQKCFDAALNYIKYRPRSEVEIRQRLRRRGFDNNIVNKVILRLKEQRLIDDTAFVEYWMDNRLSFSPRSRRLIKYELRQKGIAVETADEAVSDLDDEVSAYKAGLKKVRVFAALDYDEFCSRLSNYLKWRGFSYEIIARVTARLWQEQQTFS